MTRRFLLLVALLLIFTLRGRTQNDQIDPLGSAFRLSIQDQIRKQLAPNSCAVIFSGGFHSYDSYGLFPSPFTCNPAFYYLTGKVAPDAVVVIFPELQDLAEGKVSTLLFLPNPDDQGLASLGWAYDGKFGMLEGSSAARPASQWPKFCKEILASENLEKIYTQELPSSDFGKPGAPDTKELGRIFFELMAPGYPFEAQSQKYYKEILAADSTHLEALKVRVSSVISYSMPDLRDPFFTKLFRVKSANDLLQLQKEIGAIKVDLLKFDAWFANLVGKKSSKEIELLRIASKNLKDAFKGSISRLKNGVTEAEAALMAYFSMTRNRGRIPMPARVASGVHSAQPNYYENRGVLKDGDLVVVDMAASQEGYAVRASRTFAVGGKFSSDDASVYDAILRIHKKNLNGCISGAKLSDLNEAANIDFDELHKSKVFSINAIGQKIVMQISNFRLAGLGFELMPIPSKLESGMVLEVETALYLPDSRGVTDKWKNKGYVLRDFVLIKDTGNEVLTREIPTETEGLLLWMNSTNSIPLD